MTSSCIFVKIVLNENTCTDLRNACKTNNIVQAEKASHENLPVAFDEGELVAEGCNDGL
jgi:hypothetical protein